jgi:hypothetical protein
MHRRSHPDMMGENWLPQAPTNLALDPIQREVSTCTITAALVSIVAVEQNRACSQTWLDSVTDHDWVIRFGSSSGLELLVPVSRALASPEESISCSNTSWVTATERAVVRFWNWVSGNESQFEPADGVNTDGILFPLVVLTGGVSKHSSGLDGGKPTGPAIVWGSDGQQSAHAYGVLNFTDSHFVVRDARQGNLVHPKGWSFCDPQGQKTPCDANHGVMLAPRTACGNWTVGWVSIPLLVQVS